MGTEYLQAPISRGAVQVRCTTAQSPMSAAQRQRLGTYTAARRWIRGVCRLSVAKELLSFPLSTVLQPFSSFRPLETRQRPICH